MGRTSLGVAHGLSIRISGATVRFEDSEFAADRSVIRYAALGPARAVPRLPTSGYGARVMGVAARSAGARVCRIWAAGIGCRC